MNRGSSLRLLVPAAAAALLVPAAGAGAAKPPSGAKVQANPLNLLAPGWSTAKVAQGPSLAVSRLSSAPASARPGGTYRLHGTVTNSGSRGATGRVVVHLMRPDSRPVVIGRTSVHTAALATSPTARPRATTRSGGRPATPGRARAAGSS